ncbi:phage tail assembly protein T [Streptomyces sp. bgisy032]|uniref:phage tail assembly protein T n=1 Tax=Streptomyces sp. bgisy032 TaxID=3413773 RepID=UPI003D7455F2
MTVRELLARTSSRELTEWMAYEKITGPLDTRLRTDIAAGIVAATVHNSQGPKKRAKVSDFIPTWFKRRKTPAEIWQDVLKANAALGGSIRERTQEGGS